MDNDAMWERLKDASAPVFKLGAIGPYICPRDADATSSPDNAPLSYVVNTGAWDWDGNMYKGDPIENGLFQNLTEPNARTMRLENIKDGASLTLMLSENVQKNGDYSWLGVPQNQMGEQHLGMVWVANVNPYATAPTDTYQQVRIGQEAPAFAPDMPWFARPTSGHSGGVFNVVFADGSGRNLTAEIDYTVYQRLLTSNGRKCVDPLGAPPPAAVSADIQAFRDLPPLSTADLDK
jgi:prepilin-type processing-associated H-X9-DG protein